MLQRVKLNWLTAVNVSHNWNRPRWIIAEYKKTNATDSKPSHEEITFSMSPLRERTFPIRVLRLPISGLYNSLSTRSVYVFLALCCFDRVFYDALALCEWSSTFFTLLYILSPNPFIFLSIFLQRTFLVLRAMHNFWLR